MNWWWALACITCHYFSLLKFTINLIRCLFFKEKKYLQDLAETHLMRLLLIFLLALCSRAFLSYLRPDRLVLCTYGWSYVTLVFSSSMGCWLVEPKNELGDKSPWAWDETGQAHWREIHWRLTKCLETTSNSESSWTEKCLEAGWVLRGGITCDSCPVPTAFS